VLALKVLSTANLVDCVPGSAAVLEVRVTTATQTVSLRRVQDWLEGGSKTPREQALKQRRREMLEGPSTVARTGRPESRIRMTRASGPSAIVCQDYKSMDSGSGFW
jgi:hypothetical protein